MRPRSSREPLNLRHEIDANRSDSQLDSCSRLDQIVNGIPTFGPEEVFQCVQNALCVFRTWLDENIEILCRAGSCVVGKCMGANVRYLTRCSFKEPMNST
jgi:hypothetical protein